MTQETAPRSGVSGWFSRVNKKVLFAIVIVVAAVGVLIGTQLRGALTYYVTVDELRAKAPGVYGDRIRVGGRVQAGTVQKDASNNLSFSIYHSQLSDAVPVRYKGVVPDIFREEGDVVVEGVWHKEDGVFRATNLLAQHPPEFQMAGPGTPHAPVKDRAPSGA